MLMWLKIFYPFLPFLPFPSVICKGRHFPTRGNVHLPWGLERGLDPFLPFFLLCTRYTWCESTTIFLCWFVQYVNKTRKHWRHWQPSHVVWYSIYDQRSFWCFETLDSRVGIVGARAWGWTPQFVSTDTHFWVKIGFKFQSLGKISNISAYDPPVLLGQFQHCLTVPIWVHQTGDDMYEWCHKKKSRARAYDTMHSPSVKWKYDTTSKVTNA